MLQHSTDLDQYISGNDWWKRDEKACTRSSGRNMWTNHPLLWSAALVETVDGGTIGHGELPGRNLWAIHWKLMTQRTSPDLEWIRRPGDLEVGSRAGRVERRQGRATAARRSGASLAPAASKIAYGGGHGGGSMWQGCGCAVDLWKDD
jgi:hypothetical protein